MPLHFYNFIVIFALLILEKKLGKEIKSMLLKNSFEAQLMFNIVAKILY